MAGKKQYVWIDGKYVEWGKANVHILTHSMQYGSGIFEGVRSYETRRGAAIFRLDDHTKRFINSAKICGMALAASQHTMHEAVVGTVKKNGLKHAYIRPFAFYNNSQIGLDVTGKLVSVAVAALPFGNYFDNKSKGIRCMTSAWRRINPSILPTQAKISGNYANSVIASLEAKKWMADEAILLSENGLVAEGPGENIFFVSDGKLITPSKDADILLGITRDSVIKIAEDMGIVVEERQVHREEMYTADEAFFTGTAAEITPIVQIDKRSVGNGKPGAITALLQGRYSAAVQGELPSFEHWLTYV
jgi:branched-chain amino acid aminotransferase